MKLPQLSGKEVSKFLEKEGFVAIRQKGSHRFFQHFDGRKVTVPIHSNKDIGRGLLKAILEEIGMAREEFFERYK
ncbi:MAG TPA: type II toxin-antitoxin system HicA family toxin [Candidatus Nanoarchaeia archaeon]|nr:type II toxin-antitoxin system HicA family toxin [Candidatus Nanoarchaeia archaeon]